MNASNKQSELVKKLASAWEQKNSKVARAGGVSLMALTLAACGGSDDTPFSQVDVDSAVTAANAAAAAEAAAAATAAAASEAAAVASAEATAAEAATTAAAAAAASEAAAVAAAEATAAEAATAAAAAAAASEAAAVAAAEATAAEAATAAAAAAAADIAAANAAQATAEAAAATAATAQAAAETAQAAAETAQATAEADKATAEAAQAAAEADAATAATAQAAAEAAQAAAETAQAAAETAQAAAETAQAAAETAQAAAEAALADVNADIAAAGFADIDALVAAYTVLTTAASEGLTTGNDTPALTTVNDTVTATSTTYTAGDIIVDGSQTDSDTLTVTATGDITATPTVVNIENVNFNIGETLASGNNEFSVAVDNISGATVTFDVTADDSLITNLAITGAGTNTYTASSDFSTIAMTTVAADADIVLNVSADASLTTTGAADDLTVVGGANNVTVTSTEATEDLVVSGADVDINSGATGNAIDTAGALTVTATGSAAVDADTNAGAISVTAGTTVVLEADSAASTLDVTAGTNATIGNGTAVGGTVGNVTAGGDAIVQTALSGNLTVSATNNVDVDDTTTTGSVTVTAGSSLATGGLAPTDNNINVSAAEGTVTVTSSDVTVVDASAAATLIVSNAGATALEDVDIDAAAATTITVTSVGDIAFTAAAAAVETANLTFAEDSTLNLTGASDAVVNITATDDVTATMTLGGAGVVSAINVDNGGNAVVVDASAANITTEVVTTSGSGTTVLELSTAGTADVSNVATDITISLGDDFDNTTLTAANSGADIRLTDDQTAGTAIGVITAETAANTDNSITISTVATNAAATLAGLTLTDYKDVTFDASDATITFSGVLSGDQLSTVTLLGDNAVSFGTTSIANTATTATAVTVNAAAMTAGLTIDLNGASGGVETVQGSTVADDIDATAVSDSGDAYVINLNGGNDTVTVSASATSTIDGGAGNDTIEMAGAANVTVTGGAGIDTLAVAAGVDLSSSTLDLTSVEQIELTGGGADQTFAASYLTGKSFIIAEDGTGAADLAVSMDQLTVDLSGLGFASSFATGDNLIIDASGLGLGATIVGSSAADEIDGSATVDAITAGEGTDTVTSGNGADVITLTETTAAVDILIYAEEGAANADTVTGFTAVAADDVIHIDVSAINGAAISDTAGTAMTAGTAHTMIEYTVGSVLASNTAGAAVLKVTNTTGIDAFSDVDTAIDANNITFDASGGAFEDGEGILTVFYDADDGEAVVGYMESDTDDVFDNGNTFVEITSLVMSTSEYDALVAANFDIV